jgi:hypothetical protein
VFVREPDRGDDVRGALGEHDDVGVATGREVEAVRRLRVAGVVRGKRRPVEPGGEPLDGALREGGGAAVARGVRCGVGHVVPSVGVGGRGDRRAVAHDERRPAVIATATVVPLRWTRAPTGRTRRAAA